MASIRFRSNKWQARVSRKGEQSLVKTFQSKEDADRWARSIEVEWDRGTYTNTHQAQKTTFGELIERYLREVTQPTKPVTATKKNNFVSMFIFSFSFR
jgi:hypothetical protein